MDRRSTSDWLLMPAIAKAASLVAILVCSFSLPIQANELQVWIRAFIPNQHLGNKNYIVPVPNSPGQWMIPAPSLGPFDKLTQLVSSVPLNGDTCFATDDRGFDSAINASARLTTAFKVIVDGQARSIEPLISNTINFSGQSKAFNCASGKMLMSKPGRLQVDAVGGPHVAEGKTQVIVQAAASLPFISGSAWIDYSADFIFDRSKSVLSYKFTFDRFPAYEGYARLDNGSVHRLFAVNPQGDDVWSLFDLGAGIAPRVLTGEVEF
jgi:hypothetical protein